MCERYDDGFECHLLNEKHRFYVGRLPGEKILTREQFNYLWELHPTEYLKIKMYGHPVDTPRWQQAYGHDYHYTGQVNRALPVPPLLDPTLTWAKTTIDERLNGILLNWYDAQLRHYIGKHRDSLTEIVNGSPIVTISFGEERIFRLRPWKGEGSKDFPATNGTVFIMPYETNLAWTHEVPHFRAYRGRRISVTIRAFTVGE